MLNIIPISLEQGLAYALVALGIALTFRVLSFPDLTVDGSFPLGGAVAARLIFDGLDPVTSTFIAMAAGFVAGCLTGIFATKFKINSQWKIWIYPAISRLSFSSSSLLRFAR
jgi:putative ABC transport system permease protein